MTSSATDHAPTDTVPGAQTIPANQTLVFSKAKGNAITVADRDGDKLVVILFVNDGALTLKAAGAAKITDNGTAKVTLTGTAADINATLDGLVYRGSHQADSLVISVSDGGLVTADAIQLGFNGFDHAPTIAVPGAQTMSAGKVVFSAATHNALTVGDADNDSLTVDVGASHGIVKAKAAAGVTIKTIGDTVELTGAAAAINKALDGLTYTQDAGFHGPDGLYLEVQDRGFDLYKYVGLQTDKVDHAPGLALPTGQLVGASGKVAFSKAGGDAVTVSDADGDKLTATLTSASGTLAATAAAGAKVATDANGTLVVTGTAAQINATLNSLVFTATSHGDGTISVSVTDGTVTTAGSIAVAGIDHAPGLRASGGQEFDASGHVTFSAANKNAITVADADNDQVRVQLFATSEEAKLTVVKHGAVTISGNNTYEVLLSGTAKDVNATLNGLRWTSDPQNHGEDTLQISVDDGVDYTRGVVGLTPATVVRGPSHVLPAGQTVGTDGALVFNAAQKDALTVVTPDGDVVSTTLRVSDGTLKIAATHGTTVTGNNSGQVTLVGTGAAITAALSGLAYHADAGYFGPDDLTVTTTDGVFTIAGDVNLAAGKVDHAPTVTVPGGQSFDAANAAAFTKAKGDAIAVGDADGGPVSVRIYTDHGSADTPTVKAAGHAVTDERFGILTVSGTVADVNATLATLTVTQTDSFYEGTTEAVHVDVSDGLFTTTRSIGVTGHGQTGTLPVNTAPVALTVGANGHLAFASGLKVADADGSSLTVTLSTSHGTLAAAKKGADTVDVDFYGNVTITGTTADINKSLATLTYQADDGYRSTDMLTMTTTDGTSFNSLPAKVVSSVTLQPIAMDLAPANSVPGWQAIGAGGKIAFKAATGNAIRVSDPDNDKLTVDLSVREGTLHATAGAGATLDFNDSSYIEVTGTAAAVNKTLATLVYTQTTAVPDTLHVDTSDGTFKADSDIALGKLAANHAPGFVLPAGQMMSASGAITFSHAKGNAITVSDADNDILSVEIETPNGTFTLNSGPAQVQFSPFSHGDVTLTGTAAQINAALNGLVYQENSNALGTDDSISIVGVNDGKFSGFISGQVDLTAPRTSGGPQISEPGGQILPASGKLVFGASHHNAITVAAPGQSSVTVLVSVEDGSLAATAAGAASIATFGTGSLEIIGSVADVNATLDGLSYTHAAGTHASDDLSVSLGSLTSNVAIGVADKPPTITAPDSLTLPASGKIVFGKASGHVISVSDPDKDDVTVIVYPDDGTLSAVADGAAQVFHPFLNPDSLAITGSLADVNSTLDGLVFQRNAGDKESGVLTVEVIENPSQSIYTGGGYDISSTIALNSSFKDKPPVNALPAAQTVADNSTLAFNSAHHNAISIANPGGQPLSASLAVSHGTLAMKAAGAATVTDEGGGALFAIAGNAHDINATLASLVYTPDKGFHGQDALTLISSDLDLSDADTVGITVKQVPIQGTAGNNVLNGTVFDDTINGLGGADRIAGGLGNDRISGGAGNDAFVFNTKLGADNVDTITDFTPNGDKIDLSHAVFTKLAAGALPASEFHAGAKAADANDYILYVKATGALYYDADGSGAHAAVHFATLSTHPALTAADFLVV